VEVRKGIIEELPVDSGSVDWVLSNCVINLSPEKPKVFREIARVLRPGGQMLVSDIVASDLPAQARESAALYASCISGAIGEQEYLAGLRAVGLTDVAVRDRLVYDADQLAAIASSEGESACGCGQAMSKEAAVQVGRFLAGKVWSTKIYARKPV
jgi:SAM-dependent methyltransferase